MGVGVGVGGCASKILHTGMLSPRSSSGRFLWAHRQRCLGWVWAASVAHLGAHRTRPPSPGLCPSIQEVPGGKGGSKARAKGRSCVDLPGQGRRAAWGPKRLLALWGGSSRSWKTPGGAARRHLAAEVADDNVLSKASSDLEPKGGRFPGLGQGVEVGAGWGRSQGSPAQSGTG